LQLATTWTQYFVDFSDLRQEGWGDPVAFEPSKVYGVEFATPEMETKFDLWIDDVRFY
jgi:hypothetical protein